MKSLLIFGILVVSLTTARGELTWKTTSLDLKPAPTDESAVGKFEYQNKGDKPVHINSVHTSCGCTTAALAKNDVAPGEKGEITANFKIGDRSGLQTKTITVETDDPKEPKTVLILRATITPALEMKPSFVYWQANEAPNPKVIEVTAAKELGVKNIEVVSSSPDFTARLQPTTIDGEFKIAVQPKDTSKMTGATLTIKPEAASNVKKVFYARAQVTAPPPAAPTH